MMRCRYLSENLVSSEATKQWSPKDGVWLAGWMKYQIFVPILLLQFLNLFWYFLIWRILYR
jgi:very-long-chain ceramide synthase